MVLFRVIEFTNLELNRYRTRTTKKMGRKAADIYSFTNRGEILAVIGLWLSLGVNGYHGIPANDIFSTKKGLMSIGSHR
jgi:hypothetical protein